MKTQIFDKIDYKDLIRILILNRRNPARKLHHRKNKNEKKKSSEKTKGENFDRKSN